MPIIEDDKQSEIVSLKDIEETYNANKKYKQARSIEELIADHEYKPLKFNKDLGTYETIKVGLQQAKLSAASIPTTGKIFFGQLTNSLSSYMPKENNGFLSDYFNQDNLKRVGDQLIESARDEALDLIQRKKDILEETPISEEEQKSWTMAFTTGLVDFTSMIGFAALGARVGGAKGAKAALSIYMTLRSISETEMNIIEKAIEENNFDSLKEINNKQVLLTLSKAGVNVALENVFGTGKTFDNVVNAIKGKSKTYFEKAILDASASYLKGFGRELATEEAQTISDTFFDNLMDMYKTPQEAFQSFKDQQKGVIVAGILGGTAEAGGNIYSHRKAVNELVNALHKDKDNLSKRIESNLSNVIADETERKSVAQKAVENILNNASDVANGFYYDSSTELMKAMASSVEVSGQLKREYGDIYNAFVRSAQEAIKNSKGFKGVSEDEIAQYASDSAKKFADTALSEALKRNQNILDVIGNARIVAKGNQIVFDTSVSPDEVKVDIKKQPETSEAVEYVDVETPSRREALNEIKDAESGDFVRVGDKKVPVNYEIVEMDDLKTSHTPEGARVKDYPEYLQNRDRARPELVQQVNQISNNIQPERLGKNVVATEGAPIVTAEGYVATGNGRANAIKLAYRKGKADNYKQYLQDNGFDVSNFKNPVLVRKLTESYSPEAMRVFIEEGNVAGTQQMSVSEQALGDARKLTPEIMALYNFDEDIDSSGNKVFANKVFNEIIPEVEQARYVDDQNFMSADGIKRIKNATLAYILPNNKLLSNILESEDETIRKASKGLLESGAKIVSLEEAIKSGSVGSDYSIIDDIRGAFELYIGAKRSKQNVEAYIKNEDIFNKRNAVQQKLAEVFLKANNAGQIKNLLNAYVNSAMTEGDLNQGALFGTPLSKEAILNNLLGVQELYQIADENDYLDSIYPEYTGETININGVERSVYNSNGERINKSKEALENFYKWFGDSKVVDEQGRPLVVYHGTKSEFDTFDFDKIGTTGTSEGVGFYFTNKRSTAEQYGNILSVYIKADRILSYSKKTITKNELKEILKETAILESNETGEDIQDGFLSNYSYSDDLDFNAEVASDNIYEYGKTDEEMLSSATTGVSTEYILKSINKVLGKSVIQTNGYQDTRNEEIGNIYVAFEPNQIKSTENMGTYSADEDNIYYQTAFAGSRVDYDKPSLEAIGSGEGAQAHGWGLYYALNKDVAERYRRNFVRGATKDVYDGKEIKYLRKAEKDKKPAIYRVAHDFFYNAFYDESDLNRSKLNAMERWYEWDLSMARLKGEKNRAKIAQENLEALKTFDISKAREVEAGQVHEVDIPENPYLLDEDLKINEQDETIRKNVRDLLNSFPDDFIETNDINNFGGMTGSSLYKDLMFIAQRKGIDKTIDKQKFASQKLSEFGIKGITYFGEQDGRCFVIFNPDDVKVIQKFYQEESDLSSGIDLEISEQRQREIENLSNQQKTSNVGKNLYDKDFDSWVREKAINEEMQRIDEESTFREAEDYLGSIEDANEEIAEYPDSNEYERTTPFTEKEYLDYYKEEMKSKVEDDISETINSYDSYYIDQLRNEYSSGSNRDLFFDDYQMLVYNIMIDNGFYVKENESRVSDSRYIDVYRSEDDYLDGESPFSQIRISDHDTKKFYGHHINLYTTNDINSEIEKLKNAFSIADYGIDRTVYQGENKNKRLTKEAKRLIRGSYDRDNKVITLLKDANFSTLPHEMAHYWLDNMASYVSSGIASDAYLKNFTAITNWIGKPSPLGKFNGDQQEKFARGYEKYLYNGSLPNKLISGAFDDYDKYLKRVYYSAQALKVDLSDDAIQFFRTMTTGELIDFTASKEQIERVQAKEFKKEYEAQEKETIESLDNPMFSETEKNNAVIESRNEIVQKPVIGTGEEKESRFNARMNEMLGDGEAVTYTAVNLKDEHEKARKLWESNPKRAREIMESDDPQNEYLRNAITNEYNKMMLEQGNYEEFHKSVSAQSLRATRLGQEISALRSDVSMPEYWIKKAENNLLEKLGDIKSDYLDGVKDAFAGEKNASKIANEIDRDVERITNDILNAQGNKDKNNILYQEIEKMRKKYKGLQQPKKEKIFIDFDQLELQGISTRHGYLKNQIENIVYKSIGARLSEDNVKLFIAESERLKKLLSRSDIFGNPTPEYFKALNELNNKILALTPTNNVKVFFSTILRGSMLTSTGTYTLNLGSNIANYEFEKATRYISNALLGHTNKNIVSKELQKELSKAITTNYKTGNIDIAFTNDYKDTMTYNGEKISHSQGKGIIRKVARGIETLSFKWLTGHPDIVVKSKWAFVDYLGNEATELALNKYKLTGQEAVNKANEIFKDASRIEPLTDDGVLVRGKAQSDALAVTFQQSTLFSEGALKMRSGLDKLLGGVGIAEWIAPFVKTPINIAYTGLEIAMPVVAHPIAIMRAFSGDPGAKRVAVRSLVKSALGLSIIALIASTYIDDDDYIPDYEMLSRKQRKAVNETGGVYGAIKIGNYWVSTDYFGVLETPLIAILNARRTKKIMSVDYFKKYLDGMIKSYMDLPVISELADSYDTASNIMSERVDSLDALSSALFEKSIVNVVPNFVGQVSKLTDDYERTINYKDVFSGGVDKLKSKIPFVRESLDPKKSLTTGRNIETQSWYLNLLSGSRIKKEQKDRVSREIMRLAMTPYAVNIEDVTTRGKLSSLSDKEKKAVRKEYVKSFSQEVNSLIRTSEYKKADDEDKSKMIKKVRDRIVKKVKNDYGI